MAQDIRTYPGLVEAIQGWLDSAEASLVDAIPNMIALAEADFRRTIVTPEMEVTVTLDPSLGLLPSDIDSIRTLAILGASQRAMTAIPPSEFYSLPSTETGQPSFYAVTNGKLLVWPIPSTAYTASLIYRQAIPPLSATNPTNWLLTSHPDAYLFGSLLQAEFRGWNDTRLPIIQAKLASVIDDINKAGNRKRYGGPLIMQTRAYDGVWARV